MFFLSHNLMIVLCFILCSSPVLNAAIDTLNATDSLSINKTLISATGKFELGFFSKGNPKRYYVGIWYKDIPFDDIIVWVANRDAPSFSDSCLLKIGTHGNLVVLDNGSKIRWSSSNRSTAANPAVVAQLLDSGNLVIREAEDHYLWQSFDYPTDTLLPGQKLGSNLKTGLNWSLTSWNGPEDPGSGPYSIKLNYDGDPEFYLWENGRVIYRTGPWVGVRFSGIPQMGLSSDFSNQSFYSGPDEVYYISQLPKDEAVKQRIIVSYDGFFRWYTWNPNGSQWNVYWYARMDPCETYTVCGPNAVCNASAIVFCQCPLGFQPENPVDYWDLSDRSGGCVRESKLECGSDVFLGLENMKLPQTSNASVNANMSIDQCRDMCKKDCNCVAYANWKVIEGVNTGCITWTGNLIDMRSFSENGEKLYIRKAFSYLDTTGGNVNKKTLLHILVAISVPLIAIMIAIGIWVRRRKFRLTSNADIDEIKMVESLQFDLSSITTATHNFSESNKLGEGGFGEVYKGILEDGQEIAVKRLSKSSAQGVIEFKNEIVLVAKLQHKNLVKLLGFCLTSNEKILVYEYLPNSSLYQVLFDSTKRPTLNWVTRFKVVVGIARGLLYLHEDSRLKIIHRDLKPSNILLDENMNAKISDFGLAKLFGMDQTQDNTNRIAGTYGYMAPEYATTGQFSTKSDVYSFGIIVLEIVSGQKNRYLGMYQFEDALLHRAWRLWEEGKALDLVDTTLGLDYPADEVIKCIKIGLLCVQENATDRPKMGTVVSVLRGEPVTIPMPKPPRCFGNTTITITETIYSGTTNNITDLYPR